MTDNVRGGRTKTNKATKDKRKILKKPKVKK